MIRLRSFIAAALSRFAVPVIQGSKLAGTMQYELNDYEWRDIKPKLQALHVRLKHGRSCVDTLLGLVGRC
jgi:hypothetical protein